MSFPVTAEVPLMYKWENLVPSLTETLKSQGVTESDVLVEHYAWLLHITSWSFGFDWDPKHNVICVEIPFDGPLKTLDTTKDTADYDADISQDPISVLLSRCLAEVPLKRLLAHFHRVANTK